ncbi:MAG: adenylate cyclase [Blastopirellula sp.]|nr:MAG: adenylate cyclase [Blastopirellula sp.]
MPSNIEIKLAVSDRSSLESLVQPLADSGPELLVQEDIFFCTDSGRLKLRIINQEYAELIHYHRPNIAGIRQSVYVRTPVPEPDALQAILAETMGQLGIVRKRRTLYLIGQTRVHLDEVEQLGSFLELEVVLKEGQASEAGEQIATQLLEKLQLSNEPLIAGAYLELIQSKQR